MQVALIALATSLLLAGPQPGSAEEAPAESYTIPGCLVTLIEDVDVPAQEAGVLKELLVREGDEVSKGDPLGRIDDELEQKLKKVAEYKLQVAQKEAGNDYSVQAAKANELVTEAEVKQAQEADRRKPGTVAPAEFNRMLLQNRHASLQWKQAVYDQEIAAVSVQVREAEDGVAALQIDRRRIAASLDGIVMERYFDEGEWVRPGDPVLRIIRMDRLRIEGFVDATKVSPAQVSVGQKVTVVPDSDEPLPGGPDAAQEPREGEIVFVSPVVEAGPRFLVWAEVANEGHDGYWPLRPGFHADMTISLRPIGPPKRTAQLANP
ncbi:MAG: hypothetical protein A2V98_06025 [Planctomycetes bacterium RBG_16_64_12]|nr:MAG: hypothetical protein A2V98_06025 [Planctomycetes bacterium RBG_16_64_12]